MFDISTAAATVDRPLPSWSERLRAAADALRAGRPVLLTDDDDPENKADLIVAAIELTEPVMALLIRECSGIVCLCMPPETIERLRLPPMVSHNQSRYGTAFTVSIEGRHGVTTGVSAADWPTDAQLRRSPAVIR